MAHPQNKKLSNQIKPRNWYDDLEFSDEDKAPSGVRIVDLPGGTVINTPDGLMMVTGSYLVDFDPHCVDCEEMMPTMFGPWNKWTESNFNKNGGVLADEHYGRNWKLVMLPVEVFDFVMPDVLGALARMGVERNISLSLKGGAFFDGFPTS